MRVADAVSCGVGPPQWNLSTAWAWLTAMTTQMASTSDRSGTRLLSETVTKVPGLSSSGDRPRQHGLDFPLFWGHHVMGTPRAYKFFVKISADRLNLSTPEARYVKNKDRILGDAD
jgi:hypothetical protein